MITRRILNQLSKSGYQITNFTYKNSINDLPKLNFQAKKQKEIQIKDFINIPDFKITDFNLKLKDINNNTTYRYLYDLEFNLIQRDSEGNYQYEQFHNFRYPANLDTQTICAVNINDILNYYLSKLNCIPQGFNSFVYNINNIVFRKFDIDNKSLIDILNHLQDYGFYWYVWQNKIYINSYTNLTPWATIKLIQPQIQAYKNQETSFKLIKEPSNQEYNRSYFFKLPTNYEFTVEFKLEKPLKFNNWTVYLNLDLGIVQYNDWYAIKIYAYNSETKKAASIFRYQKDDGSFYPESNISFFDKDQIYYYFVYEGYPARTRKCQGSTTLICLSDFIRPCVVITPTDIYDCTNNYFDLLRYTLNYGDCYDTIIVRYHGNLLVGPNNSLELRMGVSTLNNAFCLPTGLSPNCIEFNDFEFTEQIHTINQSNCYKIPEKRFSNIIYPSDWTKIKNYYELIASSPEFFEIKSYILPEYINYFGKRVNLIYNIYSRIGNEENIIFRNFLFKELEITPQGIVGVFSYPI